MSLALLLVSAALAAPTKGITLVLAEGQPSLADWGQAIEAVEKGGPDAVVLKFFIEGADPDVDKLAKLAAKHKNLYFQAAGLQEGALPEEHLLAPAALRTEGTPKLEEFPTVMLPPKPLIGAAAGIGLVHVKLDAKGAADRWQAAAAVLAGAVASLPVVLAAKGLGLSRDQVVLSQGARGLELRFGARRVALDAEGAYRIRFNKPPNGYPSYDLADVIKGEVNRSVFTRRIVILGTENAADAMKTPVSDAHNKVRVFADALNTLLQLAGK